MDRAKIIEWIEVLRSGKYQQAQNKLRKGDGFCCLGVLCDISAKGAWNNNVYKSTDALYGESEFLPSCLNLSCQPKVFDNNGEMEFRDYSKHIVTLSGANDAGCTFPQIADLIEYFILPNFSEVAQ